jgi:hypothetical protein
MCLALYLASKDELPVIPWNEEKPAFHVVHLPQSAEPVRKHFNAKHVYYVGSDQGCSCPFNYEHEYDTIVELRDYLRNALICVDEVEMFSCQTGSEGMDRQHSRNISPEGIALAEFHFRDRQYLLVKQGKNSDFATEAERCLRRATQAVPVINSDCARLVPAG